MLLRKPLLSSFALKRTGSILESIPRIIGGRGSINIQLTPKGLTNRYIEIIIEWMINQAEKEKIKRRNE